MSQFSLALFLIVFGLNHLFGLPIPLWVTGLLAVLAGVMIAIRRYGFPSRFRKHAGQSVEPNG